MMRRVFEETAHLKQKCTQNDTFGYQIPGGLPALEYLPPTTHLPTEYTPLPNNLFAYLQMVYLYEVLSTNLLPRYSYCK